MRLAVISSAPLVEKNATLFAYSPYVKELDVWTKHSHEIAFMCPLWRNDKGLLISEITFPVAKHFRAREFNIKSVKNLIFAVRYSFLNFYNIYRAMRWAEHIHLRCPGNVGLMGCLVQILFPGKPKTAKYAGNWDPKSKQPWSYNLQKWILNNTFLTHNMTVLVYGSWSGASKNIKPFFTASYSDAQKELVPPRTILNQPIRFMFVGTLSPGKRPLYAIELVNNLIKKGIDATLDIYGQGSEHSTLSDYIEKHQLEQRVRLLGNHPSEVITDAYKRNHFLILPSKSEGWPKVVAEAMFWGCVPLSTSISCVPEMLGNGSRGILLDVMVDEDSRKLTELLADEQKYNQMTTEAVAWSRQFTTDVFEHEIANLLSNGNNADSTNNR